MSHQPYTYQVSCLNALATLRKKNKHQALVVMASGLGKTFTAAKDVQCYRSRHPCKVLYLCHQNDILEQAERTFKTVLPCRTTYGYFNGLRKHRNVDCLFATFQTMEEHYEEFDPKEFGYLVVDESHHGPAPTYRPTIDYFKPDFLLALTATPDRADLQDIRQLYGPEVYSLPLEDALAEGLLTRVDYRLMSDELQNLKFLNTSVGKISIRELNRKLFVPKRDKEIARIVQERIAEVKDARVMIFCPSISYCDRLVKYLPKSIAVHSKMPRTVQNKRLDAFRSGEDNIVLTVDKFNEGIDVPEANVIVFLRSTSSRTIFFQQLGRGLRKVRGKKQVLVLDFVGNCERLEMVHKLWQFVQAKHKAITKTRRRRPSGLPIVINYGKVEFAEEVKLVLDVIDAIRRGYTREILVKQLREAAEELGHAPSAPEINRLSRSGKYAAHATFVKHFGSWNAAIKAASLPTHAYRSSKEEMVKALQDLANKLGRTPTAKDIIRADRTKCPSLTAVQSNFGSLVNAQLAAGFTVAKWRSRFKKLNRTVLVKQLRTLYKELKRIPTPIDINIASKAGKTSSVSTFKRYFGSYQKAKAAAKL